MSWGTSISGLSRTLDTLDEIQTRWGEDVLYVVGPTVTYGVYVERGTSRMKPQPYLKPAVREVTRSLPRITAQADSSAQATKLVALEVEALAKRFAPVDTGALRSSISTQRIR